MNRERKRGRRISKGKEVPEDYQGTIEELDRAIRRLDMLEYLVLGGAVLLALIAGAIGAYLLARGTSLPFFASWVVLSLLFFAGPGGFALWKQRRRGSGRK